MQVYIYIQPIFINEEPFTFTFYLRYWIMNIFYHKICSLFIYKEYILFCIKIVTIIFTVKFSVDTRLEIQIHYTNLKYISNTIFSISHKTELWHLNISHKISQVVIFISKAISFKLHAWFFSIMPKELKNIMWISSTALCIPFYHTIKLFYHFCFNFP